jgi:hypothetical protein
MIRTTGSLLWRLCRIISGIALLLLGLVFSIPGIPGPGIVLVVLGLGVLSHHFSWAKNIHLRLKVMWHAVLGRYHKDKRATAEKHR